MILIKNISTNEHFFNKEIKETKVNLLIKDGKVQTISQEDISVSDETQIINGANLFLAPGLCDPQVHFREPGLEYKEDIESGSRAAAKGGFTHVISMPNTSPTADNFETVRFMKEKSEKLGICHVYPTGSVTKGLLGKTLTDFTSLKEAGAIALTDDGKGVQSDEIFKQAMINAKKVDLPILDHSEDESLSAGGCIHLGAISKKYGLKGVDANSEAVHVKRGCEMSLETGCHYHALHVSTAKSLEHLKEAKAMGAKVTFELSPHHLLICDEDIPERNDGSLDSNWKMNPPLRSKQDMLACQDALISGMADAIATDHAPHSPDEKKMEISKAPFGIIGLETAFSLIYTNFVKTGKLKLTECIDLMSFKAGKLFKLDIGRITEGADANLVLIDLDKEFVVDENFFASKSKNSPFIGQKLCGAIQYTICDGKISYQAQGKL